MQTPPDRSYLRHVVFLIGGLFAGPMAVVAVSVFAPQAGPFGPLWMVAVILSFLVALVLPRVSTGNRHGRSAAAPQPLEVVDHYRRAGAI